MKVKLLLMLPLFIAGTQRGMAYDFESQGVYYNIVSEDDKTCEVTYKWQTSKTVKSNGTDRTCYYVQGYENVDVVIPRSANGYKVIGIGKHAFDRDFYNSRDMTSFLYIDPYPASNTPSVKSPTSVTINGRNLQYIDDYAFTESGLTELVLPSSVKRIGQWAFYASNIKSINLSDVETFGYQAFRSCVSLKGQDLSSAVSIGNYAFYANYQMTDITIPNSTTSIGEYSFGACGNVSSITIGTGLTNIAPYAFQNTHADTISIPAHVTSIGEKAFDGSTVSGTNITIMDSGTTLSIATADFANATTLYLGRNISCTADPFANATNVTIGNQVTSLNGILTSSKNPTITTLSIDMTDVPDNFLGRTTITTLTFGEHVNNIAAEAFADCTGLKDVWCYAPAVIATEDEYTFDGLPEDESGYYKATLHVSLELLDEYKRTAPWKYFFKIQAYPSMLGDANGDGRISLADLTATINYKKTGIERGFFFANADIDGNEQIDEEDIRLIVDMILQSVEE